MRLDESILRHLDRREIVDQSDLLTRLGKEGFEITLSTLSRHLKKLGVKKVDGVYRRQGKPLLPAMPFSIRKVPPCLLVLKTHSGFAQPLAVALDEAQLPSLAGTIAGDDTVFVAPLDGSRLDLLEEEIQRKLAGGILKQR